MKISRGLGGWKRSIYYQQMIQVSLASSLLFTMCCYSYPNSFLPLDLCIDANLKTWFPVTPRVFSVQLTMIQ